MICEFLQQIDMFRELTPQTLAAMADQLMAEQHEKGDLVIRQGDPGDKFYLIRDGSVRIEIEKDGLVEHVATIGPGDFFGEGALLTGEPRNASVVANGKVVLYTLKQTDFQAAIESSASFREEVQKALFNRQ